MKIPLSIEERIQIALLLFKNENKQRLKVVRDKSARDYLRFTGHNPLTGEVMHFLFGKYHPMKYRVIHWNRLTQCYFYSVDSGIRWERVPESLVVEYMYKTQVMI